MMQLEDERRHADQYKEQNEKVRILVLNSIPSLNFFNIWLKYYLYETKEQDFKE